MGACNLEYQRIQAVWSPFKPEKCRIVATVRLNLERGPDARRHLLLAAAMNR